jgi:hypothetical protein
MWPSTSPESGIPCLSQLRSFTKRLVGVCLPFSTLRARAGTRLEASIAAIAARSTLLMCFFHCGSADWSASALALKCWVSAHLGFIPIIGR